MVTIKKSKLPKNIKKYMIQEAYCSKEVSELLKEKGFNIPIWTRYEDNDDGDNEVIFGNKYNWNNSPMGQISAPTHQMAMAWLREVHKIFIEIGISIDLNGNYHYDYTILDDKCRYVRREYTDFDWNFEDAVEAALKYVLENLI